MLSTGDARHALENLDDKQDEEFKKIFKFLYGENFKVNLFEQLDVDKIFEVRILSVDSKYRGQGIAKKLLQKSQEVAEQNGFKVRSSIPLVHSFSNVTFSIQVMKSDATGLFSQKISESLGFVTCSEISYDQYTDDNNCPVFPVEPPHKSLKIMYKVISPEEITQF